MLIFQPKNCSLFAQFIFPSISILLILFLSPILHVISLVPTERGYEWCQAILRLLPQFPAGSSYKNMPSQPPVSLHEADPSRHFLPVVHIDLVWLILGDPYRNRVSDPESDWYLPFLRLLMTEHRSLDGRP